MRHAGGSSEQDGMDCLVSDFGNELIKRVGLSRSREVAAGSR